MNKLLHLHSRGKSQSPFWELISCLSTLKALRLHLYTKDAKETCVCEVTIKVKEKRPHMEGVCPFDPTEMIDVA
jgi:hypothetical protein